MAAVVVAQGSTDASAASGTPSTISCTVSNPNSALYVFTSTDAAVSYDATGNYNGDALTQIAKNLVPTTGGQGLTILRLINPDVGTANVSVNAGATGRIIGFAVVEGADQTTPEFAAPLVIETNGNATSLSGSPGVASDADGVVLAFCAANNNSNINFTGGTKITQDFIATANACAAIASAAGTGSDVTISASWTTTNRASLILISVRPAGGADPAPTITDVDEDDTVTSNQTNVEIDGADFDTATVEIRQGAVAIAQSIDSQDADTIIFDVVFDAGGGPHLKYGAADLAVINADDQEDEIAITIDPPSGFDFVDLSTPNTTADNRITAVADLESGDQLEISNVVGGTIADVTVLDDATFTAEEAVTSFDVRVWDADDSTWGSIATQDVVPENIELEVDDSRHGHTVETPTLSQAQVLGVADTAHGHTVDSVALTQAHLLAVADSLHAHTAENVALTQAQVIAVADAIHQHLSENVTLEVAGTLNVNDAMHGHTSENVVLAQAHILTVNDAGHGHTVESVTLSTGALLAIQDAMHAHSVDALTLSSGALLIVSDARHGHTVGSLNLTHATTLIISDALHSHLVDTLNLRLPTESLDPAILVVVRADDSAIVVVAPERF